MNLDEVLIRGTRLAFDFSEQHRKKSDSRRGGRHAQAIEHLQKTQGWLPELAWDISGAEKDHEELLQGIVRYGSRIWSFENDRDVWRQAETGLWDQCFHTKIDCRSGNPNGDVRWTWEPNRLQQLIGLALLARNYPNHRAVSLEKMKFQLYNWLEYNPASIGVNYVSAMECALRVLSVSFAAHIAHPYLKVDQKFWSAIVSLVDSHAQYIYGHLSIGSSLGNHTVAETTGLYIASLIIPGYQSTRWRKRALRTLRLACAKEFNHDGGGTEQSPSYHALIIDLLYIATTAARCHGTALEDLESYHRNGSDYLRAISHRGKLPRIGDDDSSFSLTRYMQPSWAPDKPAPLTEVRSFPETGLTVVKESGFALYFDHGPIGMRPNFAHGHADGLSILLTRDDVPILVDPGTYTYSNEAGWRDYFRSAAAHNTIHGGPAEQASNAGPFLWSNPCTASLRRRKEKAGRYFMLGEIRGWSGYVHRRALLFSQSHVLVVDEVRNVNPASLRLRWHFDDVLIQSGHSYHLSKRPVIAVSIPDCDVDIYHGSMTPRAGWISDKYGELRTATTLEAKFPNNSHRIISLFSFFSAPITDIAIENDLLSLLEFAAEGGTNEL